MDSKEKCFKCSFTKAKKIKQYNEIYNIKELFKQKIILNNLLFTILLINNKIYEIIFTILPPTKKII